jgi:hypothetical protein
LPQLHIPGLYKLLGQLLWTAAASSQELQQGQHMLPFHAGQQQHLQLVHVIPMMQELLHQGCVLLLLLLMVDCCLKQYPASAIQR